MRASFSLLSSARGGVIVTGGGSGLGEAVARRLRLDGLNVMIADLKDSSKLAQEIGASSSICDVANEKSVQGCERNAIWGWLI